MKFIKMHGCGNDYVYLDSIRQTLPQEGRGELAKRLSDRHFGVGGDGAIFINASDVADFEMEMYNADGSRAEMCGNGIRCVAKYVYDNGLTDKTDISVVSAGEVKKLKLFTEDGKVSAVTVDMGAPVLEAKLVPVLSDHERAIEEDIEVNGTIYQMTCVSMGNPHAVVFVKDVESLDLEALGPCFERHERFPNRINTEFVELVDRKHVRMRVWERGTGETLACGTGCCAVAAAGVLRGVTDRELTVYVRGGEIQIAWEEATGHIFMTGPAAAVFTGEIL